MDNNPVDQQNPMEETPDGSDSKGQGSLLDRIKSFRLLDSKLRIVIPIVIVLIVILIGGGGTYFIASQVLGTNNSQPNGNDSSIASVTLPTPTQGPTPTLKPTRVPTPTFSPSSPTLTASPAANWVPYNFSVLNLKFSYPPGWFINVAATSGAPYLYVQNFAGIFPAISLGKYAIFIGRMEQVGITTVSALTTQLALNDVSPTYLNGVSLGTPIVASTSATTINGYSTYQRIVSYSSSPSAQFQEVYVLDGVSNVVRFVPLLDTAGTLPYLNTLLGTVQFTN